MSANVLIIGNPRAGSAAHRNREDVAARITTLPGVTGIQWTATAYPGHGVTLAQGAAQKGYRYVFAAGGDGTISHVVNGIMSVSPNVDQCPIFGVLPWGTLNDFYMALSEAEAALPNEGDTQPLDVGHVRLDELEAYCCLSISIGLSSWANMHYQLAARRWGRYLAALPTVLNTLLTYRRSPGVTITLDDQPSQFRRMLAIAVSNCPSVGGGVRLTPDAKIDDGLFDLSLIKEVPLWRLAFVLAEARLRRKFRSRAMEMTRAQTIKVESRQPFSVHLDGELIPIKGSQIRRLNVHVLAGALQVVRPSRVAVHHSATVPS